MLDCLGLEEAATLPSPVVAGQQAAAGSSAEARSGDGLPAAVWYESKIDSQSRTGDVDHWVALSATAGPLPPPLVGGVCVGCMPARSSRDGGAHGVSCAWDVGAASLASPASTSLRSYSEESATAGMSGTAPLQSGKPLCCQAWACLLLQQRQLTDPQVSLRCCVRCIGEKPVKAIFVHVSSGTHVPSAPGHMHHTYLITSLHPARTLFQMTSCI